MGLKEAEIEYEIQIENYIHNYVIGTIQLALALVYMRRRARLLLFFNFIIEQP
jgi:hypothetical protein